MIHSMNLRIGPYTSIKNGTKTIEMRLYDEKRQTIKVGDQIQFGNYENNEKLIVNVKNLHICPSFADLYAKFDKVALGYNPEDKAVAEDMLDYYPIEEQNKYGVVGIEIELVEIID